MLNQTSATTVTRLNTAVGISRPQLNQQASTLSATEGHELPVAGKGTPQIQQQQASNDIQQAVREINEFVQTVQRDLSFNLDEASGRTVIKVIDRESGETIRQMPSEEMLAIVSQIRDVGKNTMRPEDVPTGLLFSGSG